MARASCQTPGCERPRFAERLCLRHCREARSIRGDLCGVAGCVAPRFSRSLCSTHSRRSYFVDRACSDCGEVRSVNPDLPGRERCGLCTRRLASPLGVLARPDLVCRDLVGPVAPRRSEWRRQVEARSRQVAAPRPNGSWHALFVAGNCPWCGDYFVRGATSAQTRPKYCSKPCRSAAGESARGRFRIPEAERLAIYERDAWECQLCGDPVDRALPTSDIWAATLDHIVPRSWTLVPDDSPENLRLAHRWCNSVRGDEMYHDASVLAVV